MTVRKPLGLVLVEGAGGAVVVEEVRLDPAPRTASARGSLTQSWFRDHSPLHRVCQHCPHCQREDLCVSP